VQSQPQIYLATVNITEVTDRPSVIDVVAVDAPVVPIPPEPPPPGEFDSMTTEAESGPVPPNPEIQWLGPDMKHGFAFRPTQDVLVHGARYWRIGQSALTVQFKLHLAQPFSSALATQDLVADTQPDSHWETILFPAPVAVPSGQEMVMWISNYTVGGPNIDMARIEAYFPAGTPMASRFGLFETVPATARFNIPAFNPEDEAPTTDHDETWYFIDPLVSEP
jgi:hypothetical protein